MAFSLSGAVRLEAYLAAAVPTRVPRRVGGTGKKRLPHGRAGLRISADRPRRTAMLLRELNRDLGFAATVVLRRPFQCFLQLTNRCNMRCGFCDFWPNGV